MITILMATYNGAKYLREQLDSLFSQTVQDFYLFISDDASTDSTISIISQYQQSYPNRINIFRRLRNSGSAKHNYLELMIDHKDDYVMLCDQDDVWFPHKIEHTLQLMEQMEHQYGKDTPLLVHTDLSLTDENLNIIHPSYQQAMCDNFERTSLNYALIQNTFPGCACMYNRALANLIVEKPLYCIMHDWWLMLVCAAFGHIGFSYEKTVLYRQHRNNSIGAQDMGTLSYKLNRLFHADEVRHAIDITYAQAYNFIQMYSSQLSPQQISLVQTYCKIPTMKKLQKLHTLLRLHVLKNTLTRKIGHFIFV